MKLLYFSQVVLGASLMGFYYPKQGNISFSSMLTIRKPKQKADGQLFHFIHTTDEASFHRRSLRAVESVFFHHPNATVLIHVPDDGETIGLTSDMTNRPFWQLIDAGYDVTIQRFKVKPLVETALSQEGSEVKRRHAEKWMNTKILPNLFGKAWPVDISDLVRLLLLYTKGGMYLDTDVIVVNPLSELPDSIGFERPGGPNNAVMKFTSPGNTFVAYAINEYFTTFRSSTYSWGFVGPRLLRRVFERKYKACQVPDFVQGRRVIAVDPSCPVTFLWKDAFYPDINQCLTSSSDVSGDISYPRQREIGARSVVSENSPISSFSDGCKAKVHPGKELSRTYL